VVGTDVEPSTPSDFAAALADVVAAAQRIWPAFRTPPGVFAAYLCERLPTDVPPTVALHRLHATDLFLACACAHGDPAALAEFDERCLGQLDRALGKIGIDRDVIAEVKQEIRCRVLVGDGRRAEISDFAGRGDLRGWIRVIATRRALRRQRHARRECVADDELWQRIVPATLPDRDREKGFYRDEFKRAFEAALRALPHRDQTLLRQHYLDGATLEELSALYRVHRATVARMLARARETVLARTRERLIAELHVPPQDLDSILRTIWSRIELSLRVLGGGRKR
jgi:RNA polymerase sigma-70 factor (ECF subfamily)